MAIPLRSTENPHQKYPPKYPRPAVVPAPKPKRARPPRPRRRDADRHPGVVLVKPDASHPYHRVRYVDVMTGKVTKPVIPFSHEGTAPGRLAYMVELSEHLAELRKQRELGAKLPINVTLADAVARWMIAGAVEWSIPTQRLYRLAVGNFVRHVGAALYVREISTEMLILFRVAAADAKVRPRGKRPGGGAKREKVSINHEIRIVKTFLRWARAGAGLTLSRDDISEALKPFKDKHERKHFYEPDVLQRLVKLARVHEAPYWPAIRCLLLTGLRMKEWRRLDWSWVDEGDRLRVPATAAKGSAYRDTDLTVTKHALPPRPAGVHSGPVFPDVTAAMLRATFQRLRTMDPALATLNAHALRRTCSTYFTCAFNPWRSAKSLGHTLAVAEKHYAGLVRVPDGCTTLEQAMGIAELLDAGTTRKPLRKSRKVRKDYKGAAA